jgi:hypothetical protein
MSDMMMVVLLDIEKVDEMVDHLVDAMETYSAVKLAVSLDMSMVE